MKKMMDKMETMNTTHQTPRDLATLTENIRSFRGIIGTLEKDFGAWNRQKDKEDLQKLIARAQKIEADLAAFMGNLHPLHRPELNDTVAITLHDAFKVTGRLFEDVKEIREKFERATLTPEKVHPLKIDWERLKKSIEILENQSKIIESETAHTFF